MIKNKEEIKIYFQTHNQSPKEVAQVFGVNYRTLMHWIEKEGWEKGSALKNLSESTLQNKLLRREICSAIDTNIRETKALIKQNLGEVVYQVDELVLNNLLDSSANEILLQAMSANFIQKNIALSAIVAKDELMKMVKLRDENKPDPMLIACAEKVNKIFIDMQNALYGKEIPRAENDNALENLSTQELLNLIND